MLKRIAIAGLGLLGGSIAKSLKVRDRSVEVRAYGRTPGSIEQAMRDGAVDSVGSLDGMDLAGVDLLIVSVPVVASIEIIRRALEDGKLGEDSLVIDVGSVKEGIIAGVIDCARADRFVGCHPMAGSEKMGYSFSTESLMTDATVFITPHGKNSGRDIDRIARFWESIGSRTVIVSPAMHDRTLSNTSHLPHMLACAYVDMVRDFNGSEAFAGVTQRIETFMGSGFRDVSRIAAGSPDMWTDICLLNPEHIHDSLALLIEKLAMLKERISGESVREEEVRAFLERVKDFRQGLVLK